MKSHERFHLSLLQKVLTDNSYSQKGSSVSRDLKYLSRRVSYEGLSFLTKILPSFGKALLRGYESSRFTPPPGFKPRKKGSLLPAFLSGWTKRIFTDEGLLLPNPDVDSIRELHQICYLFYKLETPYDSETIEKVISSFVQTEEEIKSFRLDDLPLSSREIVAQARALLADVFKGFDPKDIFPGHGPGAVATGEKGNLKYSFKRKYQRLHQKYPYYEYFSPSLSATFMDPCSYRQLEPSVLPVARVCLVPKDSRGPRLISMEPLELQWIQQGLLKKLVPHIESHKLTRYSVHFTDQTLNSRAALIASLDGMFATMDLKDASDRVSLALFRAIFPDDIVEHFEACRSVATQLPDGRLVPLSKFAPMGSALCFPVMALTLWSLITATQRLMHQRETCLVYGDDIVVPTEQVGLIRCVLTMFALKVNNEKTFSKGSFRESCGMDAYFGVPITPARFRKTLPEKGRPAIDVILHWLALEEAFFERGMWNTSKFFFDAIESFVHLPWTHDRSHIGHFCPDPLVCNERNSHWKRRLNSDYQAYDIRVPCPLPVKVKSKLNLVGRACKGLLGLYRYAGEDQLVALRGRSVMKYKWMTQS